MTMLKSNDIRSGNEEEEAYLLHLKDLQTNTDDR